MSAVSYTHLTGMAVIFCDVGQDVHIVGGDFENAVNEGVSRGGVANLFQDETIRLFLNTHPPYNSRIG